MKRDLRSLARDSYDVLIVGGGMFGAFAARAASLRGYSVALLEKGDFGAATSANHFKVAHGGIRYLQHLDLRRVRISSAERRKLLRIAPHLVYPLPILMPTYGHGLRGKELLRLGFGAYDLATWDRSRGISDPARRIPGCSFLSRSEALRRFPDLPKTDLTGGAVFYDGQIYHASRLVISALRSAVGMGAQIANYAEVTDFLQSGQRVVGVDVRDARTGESHVIRSKVVLNAAGPWAEDLVEESLGVRISPGGLPFSRDVALVTHRQLSPEMGLACPTGETEDADALVDRGGRHLFMLPWRDCTLLGVWHGLYEEPDRVEVTPAELREFVAEANRAYPGLQISVDEVSLVNTGLVLFGEKEEQEGRHHFGKRSVLVDHRDRHGVEGLVTLVGVRATTARLMANRTTKLVDAKLGQDPSGPPSGRETPLFGGDFDRFETLVEEVSRASPADWPKSATRALAHNYGSRFSDVLALCSEEGIGDNLLPGCSVSRAEAVYAARNEMAETLEDVVLRRTELGTAGHPGHAALATCGDLLASELGWSADRKREELQRLEEFYRRRGRTRTYRPSLSEAGGSP